MKLRHLLALPLAAVMAVAVTAAPAGAATAWERLSVEWNASTTRLTVDDVWSAGHQLWAVGTETRGETPGTAPREAPGAQYCSGTSCIHYVLPTDGPDVSAGIASVSGTATYDVWAVGKFADGSGNGNRPAAWHYDGRDWTVIPTGLTGNVILSNIVTPSRDESWVLGNEVSDAGFDTAVYHRLGEDWSRIDSGTFPAPCGGAGDMFADLTVVEGALVLVGQCGNDRVVLKQDGARWRLLDDGPLAAGSWGNAATISHQLWVAGTRAGKLRIQRRDYGVWKTVPTSGLPARFAVADLAGTTAAATWLVGTLRGVAQTWRLTGNHWTSVPLPTTDLYLSAVSVSGRGTAYTVGNDPRDLSPGNAEILRNSS